MAYRAYVGNLPFSFTKADLEQLFQSYGQVKSAEIISDRETGRPRGFGFVELDTNEGLQAAIAALHGKPVGGRNLTVNEARERDARGPGGPGGPPRAPGMRSGPPRAPGGETRGPPPFRPGPGPARPSGGPAGGSGGFSGGGGPSDAKRREREADRNPRRRGMDDYDRHDKRWMRGDEE